MSEKMSLSFHEEEKIKDELDLLVTIGLPDAEKRIKLAIDTNVDVQEATAYRDYCQNRIKSLGGLLSAAQVSLDPDAHFEDVLEVMKHALTEQNRLTGRMEQSHRDTVHARVKQEDAEEERDRAIQELQDYKAKRGENLGEMLDARAEADRLREKLEEVKNTSLERSLLEMWHTQGIKEIYKYKHRIIVYRREGLTGYELFTDLTCGHLFREVKDTIQMTATPSLQ